MTDPPYRDGRRGGDPDGGPAQPPPYGQQPPYGRPGPWRQQPGSVPHGATQPYARPPGGSGQPLPPPQQHWATPPGAAGPYGFPAGATPSSGVPGYGPPGDGGPPSDPTPARRGPRRGVLAVLALLAVVVLGSIAVLATTSGPTVLSRGAVERDVAVQFEQREGVAVDLECAEEMTVEQGATYECTGVTSDDERITLRIEITDEDGARYTWSEP
ncbi:DUF4333 domain-containing protein [Blastococcus sp. HT6-30]|uniref:DUF4333 domain-containing protein n=1 Tax=Blastococcus sp. HT6-30 TaxID=3144843 RepID=UPI00321A4EC2